MLTIGITGGTGLIGNHLSQLLTLRGYSVIIFSRNKNKSDSPQLRFAYWNPEANECDVDALKNINAVIHLAGAGVADKRWTAKRKKQILESRVNGTHFLMSQLKNHAPACKTIIGVSGIGYYGPDRQSINTFVEEMPPYHDFLSQVCLQWETAEKELQDTIRTVIFRIGIVLAKDGGAYQKLAQPMTYGIIPILGSGKQIVSWIHIDDLCGMMQYAIENEQLSGIYNAVAPNPITHSELMRTMAKEKGGIKILVPAPAFALKILLGQMSTEVLKSATVSADNILKAGYHFLFNTIADAVHRIESQ